MINKRHERRAITPDGVERPVLNRAARASLYIASAAVLLLVIYCYFAFGPTHVYDVASPKPGDHDDFSSFRASAAALWAGTDPYAAHGDSGGRNLNAPAWLLLFSPATLFDPIVAYRQWCVIAVAAMTAALVWTASVMRAPLLVGTLGVVALVLSGPVQYTLWQGQIYTLLALGLVTAWVLERRGRSGWSAFALGVVAGMKPSLIFLLLWPAAHRRWRDTAAAMAGLASTLVFGMCCGGPTVIITWIGWLRAFTQDGNADNASLDATFHRWFAPSKFSGHFAEIPWLTGVGPAIGVILLGVTLWAVRRHELGLFALTAACLLAAPIAWRGYLVLLAPAALILFIRPRTRPLGALIIAAAELLVSWPSLFPNKDSVFGIVGLTLPCLVLLGNWVTFIVLARIEDRDHDPAQTTTAEPATLVDA